MYKRERNDLEKDVATLKASSDMATVKKMKKQNAQLHRNLITVSNRSNNAENKIVDLEKTLKEANQIKELAVKEKQIAADKLAATKMKLSKVSRQASIQLCNAYVQKESLKHGSLWAEQNCK